MFIGQMTNTFVAIGIKVPVDGYAFYLNTYSAATIADAHWIQIKPVPVAMGLCWRN